MKVLVIAHKPPYPVIDGGCFASSKFLKNLLLIDKIESIDYFSLSTHKHPFDSQKFPSEIRSKVSLHGAEIDTKLKPLSAFVHLIQNKSYNLSRFFQQEVENEILKIANKKNIDTVIFDGLAAAVYLKTIKKLKLKCILRAHNIEFEIWNSLKNNTTNPLKKWYLNQLTKSLQREEIEIFNDLDLILTLSHDDLKQCRELTKTKACIVPVSIESETPKTDYSSADLCFLGAFNWEPNSEAITWFLNSIYPKIKEKTDVKIHIAGKDSTILEKYKSLEGVQLHGFVESPSDFLKSNGIFVAPMLSGSGVKIKVLEAMNNGLPCVLTPKAAEGLKLPETYKICKTENEFTQETLRLIDDENDRKLLGELSRNFIREHFSMEAVSETLEAALE
jgi:glycosyltransferase involved in cell wall biosynthesis